MPSQIRRPGIVSTLGVSEPYAADIRDVDRIHGIGRL
jgi:hypothetical protein